MMVGRFHRDGKQIYVLVNRLQTPIKATVTGEGEGRSVTVLDPSTGKITQVDLPADLPVDATRALMLIPAR